MKLFRYLLPDGTGPRLAVSVEGGPPVDLLRAWTESGKPTDTDMGRRLTSTAALIESGPTFWADVAAVARARTIVPEGARWVCPLDRLSSLRDFLAFEDHVVRGAQRRGVEVPEYWHQAPIYYKGNHRSIIGPEEDCPWPAYSQHLDFELELAMVIGVAGRDLSAQAATGHIFGFTVMNDFSARDIQAREMTAWLGPAKGKDFATALGPCIVTADELGPEPDLEMVCRVNGEEWGRARSSSARWSWADMIAHVSQAEDVWPGDVYGSGTPGGCCGLDLGRNLSAGDVVELEVESIGVLRNRVGEPG